jgi:hypothetical protein
MRVKCITNDIDKLNNEAVRKRLSYSIHLEGGDSNLIVNEIYTVFALTWWRDGGVRVYLNTYEKGSYPFPYPLELFEVIDPSLPANWCVSFKKQPIGEVINCISFPEWANNDDFYQDLTEGDASLIAIYKRWVKELESQINGAKINVDIN